MGTRREQYGLYATEKADFHANEIQGKSIVQDGYASNNVGGTSYNPNGTLWISFATNSDRRKALVQIEMDGLRSRLGQTPIVVWAWFKLWTPNNVSFTALDVAFYRIVDGDTCDIDDCNYRYKDISAATTWYQDGYMLAPGQDMVGVWRAGGALPTGYFDILENYSHALDTYTEHDTLVDITEELEYALAANIDLWFVIMCSVYAGGSNFPGWYWKDSSNPNKHPLLDVGYLFPIEFARADDDGDPDLSTIIDADVNGTYHFDLGAIQRGETSATVQGFIQNFSTSSFGLVEVLDDHPEYTTPVKTVGSGDAELDYVVLADNADSQKYTVIMQSPTTFNVQAESYRDNIESLNPTGAGAGGWSGSTGTNWSAPDGGLQIPTAAWQPGSLANDEIQVYVTGNTTNESWPADSNDQIQITSDSGGSPVTADWRAIPGHRELTTAAVTVGATTVKFPTRYVAAADWPADTPAFIYDPDVGLNEGLVDSVATAAISAVTFTGSGLDDCASSGNYNGSTDHSIAGGDSYRVEIDGTGTPDTFKWSKDGGSTWEATTVAVTGAAQLLDNGVYVTFTATTGHTSADRWDLDATAFSVTLKSITNDGYTYSSGSRIATSLPLTSVAASVWTTLSSAAGASESPANRVYLESVTGFSPADAVYIGHPTDPDEYEKGTISAVGSNYVDLSSNLTGDYPVRSLFSKLNSGVGTFHLRAVATAGTTEELKTARVNVRI